MRPCSVMNFRSHAAFFQSTGVVSSITRRRRLSLMSVSPWTMTCACFICPGLKCSRWRSRIHVRWPHTNTCSAGQSERCDETDPDLKWAVRRHSRHAGSALYQLDFLTPGISPRNASKRKSMRDIWNRLRNPRVRPEIRHRFLTRVGLALRGSACSPRCASIRFSTEDAGFRIAAFNSARCSAYRSTTFFRFSFFRMQLFLAIGLSFPQGVKIVPSPLSESARGEEPAYELPYCLYTNTARS